MILIYRIAFFLSIIPLISALSGFWQARGPVSHFTFETCEPIDLIRTNTSAAHYGNPNCQCGVADFAPVYDGRLQKTAITGNINDYFSTTDLTVSFYFKPLKQTGIKQTLLSKREACSAANAFEVIYIPGQPGGVEVIFSRSETIGYFDLEATLEPNTDWHHVAVTRQGQWAELYINGLQRKRVLRCAGVDIGNASPLQIASGPCDFKSYQVPFRGVVDELAVFNYALNAIEMKAWYDRTPVELAETDCIAALPFSPSY